MRRADLKAEKAFTAGPAVPAQQIHYRQMNKSYPLQYCKVRPDKADGSGYVPERLYIWAGIVTGAVEIIDTVTSRISYENNETFFRRFMEVKP